MKNVEVDIELSEDVNVEIETTANPEVEVEAALGAEVDIELTNIQVVTHYDFIFEEI